MGTKVKPEKLTRNLKGKWPLHLYRVPYTTPLSIYLGTSRPIKLAKRSLLDAATQAVSLFILVRSPAGNTSLGSAAISRLRHGQYNLPAFGQPPLIVSHIYAQTKTQVSSPDWPADSWALCVYGGGVLCRVYRPLSSPTTSWCCVYLLWHPRHSVILCQT